MNSKLIEKYMNEAIELARKVQGLVSPNPAVGALIVKNGKIISTGYTRLPGGDHAEIAALKKAGSNAKNAVMFVTLEPCCCFGRTPPCTAAIIKAGIKRVFITGKDPNPAVNGNGIRLLKKAGINVVTGILSEEAWLINRAYFKYIITGLPYIIIKSAVSLDGKIATKTGQSQWISSKESRSFSQQLRSENDAILVGKNTILRDNPQLTIRKPQKSKVFNKIILDSNLRIGLSKRVLKIDRHQRIFIATTNRAPINKIKRFEKKGINIIQTSGKKVNLKSLMKEIGKKGITSIIVEGGGEVIWSFIKGRLFDRVIVTYAPLIIGGKDAKSFVNGNGISNLSDAVWLDSFKRDIKLIKNDIILDFYRSNY